MDSALRVYHSFASRESTDMPFDARPRNVRELRVRNCFCIFCNDGVQAGTEDDRNLCAPIAQLLRGRCHAAETGGAPAGRFVAAMMSGRGDSSRGIGNVFVSAF